MSKTLLWKWSSVTKKVFMGSAGLFLLTFLAVHLVINLFLLRNDQGEWFNAAASFMSNNYIVKIFEFVLLGSFLIHITIGIILALQNRYARPIRYEVASKTPTSFLSKYMIWTGLSILLILIIHLINFYFVKLGIVPIPSGVSDKHDFYSMAIILFSSPLYCIVYYIWLLLLGFHLYHAFQSVFQTFGIHHNKYLRLIRVAAAMYAIVISIGFMIIPSYFLFFY